ncbi:MAG: acyl-CoA dehydratase activase [Candidatus Neomarinimicrobiota bacterium]
MKYVAGIDVGSTYTKAVLLSPDLKIAGRAMDLTGYKLNKIAEIVFDRVLKNSGVKAEDVGYVLATGYGRHRVSFSDLTVTDLTATARGVNYFFPGTLTILDIGGQTMKASRLDERVKVKSFRLNDKCAAGTGAFLEKTARYMGYETEEIGALVQTSKEEVSISGVCAVFAESEVINQLSLGSAPADIMHGAMSSLVRRALQLLRRVRMEAPVALTGGIMRFPTMASLLEKEINQKINIPEGELVQFTAALGAATLARKQLDKKTLNAA